MLQRKFLAFQERPFSLIYMVILQIGFGQWLLYSMGNESTK